MKKTSIVILLLLIGAGLIIWKTNTNSQIPNTSVKKQETNQLPKETTITLTNDGFSPQEIIIEKDSVVRWKNNSGDKQTVNSDDYPTNQKHKELNFGIFADGSSFVYTFTKSGEYGYHNQFKPEQKGKIIIQ